jgi:hypothetical protein
MKKALEIVAFERTHVAAANAADSAARIKSVTATSVSFIRKSLTD